ncbi:hypothetical protein CCHR01_16526 [Colletotrichum chrysophilum]|uniref:Uncharacterized protein n=1 Tax=Colletotrichum chrysophilum TaxID=1836956 RepID=A0AAD9A670_9PEZI|nr:hypothetical protein CCHR01_16526 [Colletotrichum chrysophilum]
MNGDIVTRFSPAASHIVRRPGKSLSIFRASRGGCGDSANDSVKPVCHVLSKHAHGLGVLGRNIVWWWWWQRAGKKSLHAGEGTR